MRETTQKSKTNTETATMNEQYQNQDFCFHHPSQAIVGICPFCLNEKLLAVASKQRRRSHRQEEGVPRASHSRKPSNVGLPKIFAFGSLLSRLELLHLHHHNRRETYDFDEGGAGAGGSDSQSASTSLEDSFISIKIEENGVASWDKTKESKPSEEEEEATTINIKQQACECDAAANKSVVEHGKNTGRGSLRWRKRIGHLFQLVRWKRSSKANGASASAVSAHVNGGIVKVRNNKGWIRALTRRKTCKESRAV